MVPSPAQDTPKNDRAIKTSGLAFGDFYWAAASHDESLKDRNGFWFRRIYLTFDKVMAEPLDMRLRFEMNSAGDFTSNPKLEPFAKDAYLRWKFTDQHQTYLGLSPTPTMNVVDELWSYRFLEKSVLDLQRMGATRMTHSYSSFTVTTINSPCRLIAILIHGFLGYKRVWGRLGIQYAHQKRKGDSKVDLDVLSFFGFVNVFPRVTLIGRYDRMFDPNPEGQRIAYTPFDPTAKFHFFLTGIDWKVTEEFSLIPNLEVVRYDEREDGTRPATDVMPRVTFFYRF